MQYAFKPKHGTTMCTMVLKEASKYYMRNKSDVYIGMLDASKAFDRIRHDRLFEILLKRQLPTVLTKILFDSYKRQRLQANWNGYISKQFGIYNGVKQGG